MKVMVKVCRAAKVPTEYLKGAVGADIKAEPAEVQQKILDNFGPLSPGIKFFIEAGKSVVTKEVMAFDVRTQRVPFAGVAEADPGNAREIARIDGAIEGELARMGITTEPEKYEWRCYYEAQEGNN